MRISATLSGIVGGALPFGARSRRAGDSATQPSPTAKAKNALILASRVRWVPAEQTQPWRHARNAAASQSPRSPRSSASACLSHWRNSDA